MDPKTTADATPTSTSTAEMASRTNETVIPVTVTGCRRYYRSPAAVVRNPSVVLDAAGALLRGRRKRASLMIRTALALPDLGAEKIVSRKYRYVWLCNPKVASRSIKSALIGVTPDAELFSDMTIGEIAAMRPEIEEYFSFAFVRHPFARALSFFCELKRFHLYYVEGYQAKAKEEKKNNFYSGHYGLAEAASFDDYCRWLNSQYASDAVADRHYLSQHLQIRLPDGRMPDFVGRLENLDADFGKVAIHLGLPRTAISLMNTMAGWEASPDSVRSARSAMSDQLSAANKALLKKRYDEDLIAGGYADAQAIS